jgi:hypothetical protein
MAERIKAVRRELIMRETKFRVWDKECLEMDYSGPIDDWNKRVGLLNDGDNRGDPPSGNS